MINAEKHKNELRTLLKLKKLQDCALRKDNGSFGNCYNIFCKNCVFDDKEGCTYARIKWMLSECEEPIKLSRLEYEILKHVQKEGFNFITRSNSDYLYGDLYGNLFIYKIKPIKHDGIVGWCTTGESHVLYAFNDLFQFVKWEDEKPTLIKEVLENCVIENIKEEQ